MKRKQILATFFSILVIVYVLGFCGCHRKISLTSSDKKIKVLIIYHPSDANKQPSIIPAYKSVLEEEGVPFEFVTPESVSALDFSSAVQVYPAIIIPDGVARILPKDFALRLEKYVAEGGNVLLVYDAGIKNLTGRYLNETIFSDFLGINYMTYRKLKGKNYTWGVVKFKDNESANFFQMPPGRLDENFIISGYHYGHLKYPIARIEMTKNLEEKQVFAYVLTEEKEEEEEEKENYPVVVWKKFGSGNLLYVNLPLGYLKAYVEDLPLRAVLRTFLFKISKVPHLMNTPLGKGGLVINWHVDANDDWKIIPNMEKNKFLRRNIPCSIHITAGDSCYKPGDGCGFDALGKGRQLVQELSKYGMIGSHGGWFHDWFAHNLATGKFGPKEEEEYIKKNMDALQSIVGYKIIEYSAPAGVHPQPVTTRILEQFGCVAYYYTGDAGSAPNRTFWKGQMVSDKVIAFPIMIFGKEAVSLYEMRIAKTPPEKVKEWLCDIIDYAIENRTVRLFYSHPYNVNEYPEQLQFFLDYAERKSSSGKLQIAPMSYFAQFLLRFLKTQCTFTLQDSGLEVRLKNQDGLNKITLAIPRGKYNYIEKPDFLVDEDDDYYYISCTGNETNQVLYFSGIKK